MLTPRRFYEKSFVRLLSASPEVAGELGIGTIGDQHIPVDVFSDISPAGEEYRRGLMRETLDALRALPAPADETDALNREIYEFFLRWANFGHLRGTESEALGPCDLVADHLAGAQSEVIVCLTDWHRLQSADDAEAYLSRVSAIPAQLAALRVALEERIAAGNVMPTCVTQRVVAELDALLALPLERHPLVESFDQRVGDAGRRARLERLIERGVVPAFRKLHDFLTREYPAEERAGLWRMRHGEAYYQFLLKAHTTTDLSPKDVEAVGLEELARLKAEALAAFHEMKLGDGSLVGGFAALDANAYFSTTGRGRSRVLRDIRNIVRATEEMLRPCFGLWPRASVEVRAIPQLQEANRHTTYVPPAADGSRPGAYDVNLTQVLAGNPLDLYTLTYHEAMPGHHVQLTVAQEISADLPSFRRVLVHDGYIEGWAKYAELLPQLQGVNTDPQWALARRRNELYSTANLVLDTGVHARRWTRTQAMNFFMENTGANAGIAESVVDRSIARPAQLCSYKLGMLTVLGARQRLEQRPGFDLRRFHDLILGAGSLPLALLERRIAGAAA